MGKLTHRSLHHRRHQSRNRRRPSRNRSGAGRPAEPGAAALAALAAQELLLLIADPAATAGRRFELVRGVSSVRPTSRLPGCACHPPAPPGSEAAAPDAER